MLTRYKIYRGPRPADDPLPAGERQDTRKHTRHVLRPPPEIVAAFLSDPSPAAWSGFRKSYLAELEKRFREDRAPFDELAAAATAGDVALGCNCPTKKNPDVSHCHTVLALGFMKKKYRTLDVKLPSG